MKIAHQEIGICGLSCRLCPHYHIQGESRCGGCKSEGRMKAGCPFITCAVKNRQVEFCWECDKCESCERWRKHRESGLRHDSFVSYQALENNIALIRRKGIKAFVGDQRIKESILGIMLGGFNEGRSKSYYCIAATVMTIRELDRAVSLAREQSGNDPKERAAALHKVLDKIAGKRGYLLKLRK